MTNENETAMGNANATLATLTAECERTFEAFKQADERFQAELIKLYGKRAGDMRYHSDKWPDGAQPLNMAYIVFRAAAGVWYAACDARRAYEMAL